MNYPNLILCRVSKADEYNIQERTARFVLGKENWVCIYQCAVCAFGMTFPLLDGKLGTLFFLCSECNNSGSQLDNQLCLETIPAFILLQEVHSKEIYKGTMFLSSLSCRVD
jgi:hypothetical protein